MQNKICAPDLKDFFLPLKGLKSLKYKEALEDEEMLRNNIFTKDVAFYLISGNDSDTGVILYASEAARNISGRDPQSIIGTNLVVYTPPCLHPVYATFYSTFGERQYKQGFGTIARSFHYHSQNYLLEVDYYFQVHPFATQGFCFSMLLKPVDSGKDFMYVKENGDIDCSTKSVGELLDIIPSTKKTSRVNIKELSEELALANEAFNMMVAQEKPGKTSVRKNSMALNIEAAREIYSLYSTTGRDVLLQKPSSGKSYSYNCKISTITYGPISVKLFTLERNRIGDTEAFDGRTSRRSPRISLVKRYEDMKTLDIPYENSKADETEVFDYSEEKPAGWTDIQAVYSKDFTTRDCTHRSSTRLLTGLTGTERGRVTTRNFSSTLMPHDQAEMMIAKLPPPQTDTESKVVIAVPKFSQSTGARNDKFAQKDNKSGVGGGHFGQQSSLNTSNWSRFSYKKRMSSLYKTSLELHYIPKFFRFVSPFFFLFFLGAIIGEVLLKVSLDDDVNNITLKKEILRNSEARDFQLAGAQSTVRLFWELSKGSIDASALGPFGPFMIPLYGYYVGSSLSALATINKNLLLDTTQLDKEIRDFAFAADVKMYDNYFGETPEVYTSVSNFQAMDRVIEIGLTIVELSATPNTPEANYTANFLFRNMLNDVLVKNTKISEMILESLNNEYDNSHLKIDLYLIFLMLGFGGFLFVLLVILRRQYYKEVGHLSALCRLDQIKLAVVLQSFVTFKDQLEDQGFSDWGSSDIHLYLNRFDETKHEIAKREGAKDINFKGMVKKYSLYVAKLSFFILAMFGIFIGNFAFTRSSINSFKIQQAQIYYSDHYQTRISLAFIAARELFFTNNMAMVENNIAKKELVEILGEMAAIRQETVQTLASIQESDLTEEISALALVDACPLIDATLASYCQTLKNQGIRTAFIYLLDSVESILKNQLNAYEVSDKSAASLKELQENNLELLIALYAVINAANTQISTLNNQSFENRVDTVSHNTLMWLIFSIIAMVVVGILMWKLLLEEWRGGINRFKNVLKVLPPELVLSSFILKTFLVRTSQGLLEAFKNDL